MKRAAAQPLVPEMPRPKTLGKLATPHGVSVHKAELARVYRMARESWGGTQEELAAKLGVQQRFVSLCESAEHCETFNSVHLAVGPTEWALPVMTWMVVHMGAQITRAVEIEYERHMDRLGRVVETTSGLTGAYTGACVREREDWSLASLETAHQANRVMWDACAETDRALGVLLKRARAGR